MSRRRQAPSHPQRDLRAWARQHGYSLLSSLGALLRRPMDTLLTVLVLGLALSLPLALVLTVMNVERLGQWWDGADTLSVFLALELSEAQALQVTTTISVVPGVATADPISPGEGLDALISALDMNTAQAVLDSQVLPWVVEVMPAPTASLPALLEALRAVEGVSQVVVDLDWLRRLQAVLSLAEQFARLLAVAFALGVVAVIAHSVRMDVHHRREEIEVMDLVGATASFIRRPFLYQGLWFGVAGGGLAWALVAAAIWWLQAPVEVLTASYGSDARLLGLAPGWGAMLLLGTAAAGVIAAWWVVGQHLRRLGQASVQGG